MTNKDDDEVSGSDAEHGGEQEKLSGGNGM
jgi:hypothetical protein